MIVAALGIVATLLIGWWRSERRDRQRERSYWPGLPLDLDTFNQRRNG